MDVTHAYHTDYMLSQTRSSCHKHFSTILNHNSCKSIFDCCNVHKGCQSPWLKRLGRLCSRISHRIANYRDSSSIYVHTNHHNIRDFEWRWPGRRLGRHKFTPWIIMSDGNNKSSRRDIRPQVSSNNQDLLIERCDAHREVPERAPALLPRVRPPAFRIFFVRRKKFSQPMAQCSRDVIITEAGRMLLRRLCEDKDGKAELPISCHGR